MFGKNKPITQQIQTRVTLEQQILNAVDMLGLMGCNELTMKITRDGLKSSTIDVSAQFFNSTDVKIISTLKNRNNPEFGQNSFRI